MLYGLGIMLLLLSGAFVGGSAVVPLVVAGTGAILMIIGKESHNGKQTHI